MNKAKYILVLLICSLGVAETGMIHSFSTGEVTGFFAGRTDLTSWYSACRLIENMFVWPHGPLQKRPGTYYIATTPSEIVTEVPAVPGTPATYNLTYISESGSIWAIAVGDGEISLTLDNGGSANNVGGGIVGLPCTDHPFVSGEVLRFAGTTNYSGTTYTLTAGTTANELQFSGSYVAETFDGSEIPQKLIGSLPTGAGHMVQDSSGNLYYAHINTGTVPNVYYVTKVETDGTLSPDYEWLNKAWNDISADCRGIAISDDDQDLYLWINVDGATDFGFMFKFDLTSGDETWGATAVSWPGYEISIDASGNAYAAQSAGDNDVAKFTVDTGAVTHLTLMGEPKHAPINGGCQYVCLVDNGSGIVITAGQQFALTSYAYGVNDYYNLAVRTFDDSSGYQVTVGPLVESGANTFTQTIGTGQLATEDGFIYAITATSTPDSTLYKYDSALDLVEMVAGPAYGVGLYFDLWGNLVVVNQDWSSGQDDVLWFYDTDLNYLSKIEGLYTSTLRTWDSTIGGAWIQGDAVFDGNLAVEGTDATTLTNVLTDAEGPPVRLVAFEHSIERPHVIAFGDRYMQFLKDVP